MLKNDNPFICACGVCFKRVMLGFKAGRSVTDLPNVTLRSLLLSSIFALTWKTQAL